jgi:hypothetical protein
MYDIVFGVQKYTRDEKLESRAAKKGAKKLVSSDVAKILENESSNKDRETCEKTMFTPLIQLKLQILLLLLSDRMSPNCQPEFSNIRLSDRQRKFSNLCSPDHKQRFSDRRSRIANNQTGT